MPSKDKSVADPKLTPAEKAFAEKQAANPTAGIPGVLTMGVDRRPVTMSGFAPQIPDESFVPIPEPRVATVEVGGQPVRYTPDKSA